jgi:hypothetical protein
LLFKMPSILAKMGIALLKKQPPNNNNNTLQKISDKFFRERVCCDCLIKFFCFVFL